MRWTISVALVLVVACAVPARAEFIDFTALTTSGNLSLTIGGVTITSEGMIATEAGRGLGLPGVGVDGAIERILSWNEGAEYRDLRSQERDGELAITVDGILTAMTILPFMVIDGPQPEVLPRFQMSFEPITGAEAVRRFSMATPNVPLTFQFDPAVPLGGLQKIGLFSDFSQYIYFIGYRDTFMNPEATIRFGFSIQSIEYTPVPEPASLLLLGLGTAVFLRHRRRHQ